MLNHPKPGTLFRRFHGRLALFDQNPDRGEYWKQYWNDGYRDQLLELGRRGDLGEFRALIERYVPKHLPVLDAGCGSARFVLSLRNRRFQAIGVDAEPDVVHFLRANLPELDIRLGNALHLDFPEASIGCYLSLGIMEHFEKGPLEALKEARRVLHPRGVALISVPYLNPARRELFSTLSDELLRDSVYFHQYYFSREDFARLLIEAGLQPVEFFPYAAEAFLIREHAVFSSFWRSVYCREKLKAVFRKAFNHLPAGMRSKYGHMLLAVCRPIPRAEVSKAS